MDRIAILIPCFNESRTIEKVVKDFHKVLPEAKIYVYDNNSTDSSGMIAENAGAIVRYEYLQGKGNVLRRMFREIDAECYLMVDADDTYPAESAREMTDYILNDQADMVIGDRLSSTYFVQNKRPFHGVGNALVRKCINLLFHNSITDILTGYRAFSYEFVKTFPVLSNGFEIETEITVHAVDKNMCIKSVIVNYRDRPEGSISKLNTFSDGFKVIHTIVKLFRVYRPLGYFGILAGILATLSIAFFIPVMITFVKTGLVPNFPTLIVCGFTMTAAIQSFFAGLILQTMVQKNRTDFEIELKKAAANKRVLLRETKSETDNG